MTLRARIQHALPGFTLDVDMVAGPGVTAIFGRSGAGKTTLISIISGLTRLQSGTITFDDQQLDDARRHVPPHKRRMGYVFQDARLFPHLSVAANIDYGARFASGPLAIDRGELLDLLGLHDLLDRRPPTLSGGEKQRVAIARALLSAPGMLLMDEPLAALDAPRKTEILAYLEQLKARANLPILYVSHSMDEIARLADDLIVLRDGRIAAQGPVFDLLSDPAQIPLLGVRDAGAVLSGKVLAHGEDGLTKLEVAGIPLELPGVTAPVGREVRLRILAQDVILSLDTPQGLSAMNVMPVVVRSVFDGQGPGAAVELDCNGARLLARITRRSAERLGLHPGLKCFAIVKAMAIAPDAIGAA